ETPLELAPLHADFQFVDHGPGEGLGIDAAAFEAPHRWRQQPALQEPVLREVQPESLSRIPELQQYSAEVEQRNLDARQRQLTRRLQLPARSGGRPSGA